jgi:hypothetical protein
VTETGGLRRAEFAVAAFGVTTFLLTLVFVLDAVRFHHDVLVDALEGLAVGRPHGAHLLVLGLAVFDALTLGRALRSLSRGVSAHRRLTAGLPVREQRVLGGRPVAILAGDRPYAFCAGLWSPRVYLSEAIVARLRPAELATVVAHEGHHADRRDPLRILVARAIGDAYSLRGLPARERALGELSADAAAVRRGGTAALAGALLAFEDEGIAPERVDRLAGAPPADEVPRTMLAAAALVIAGLLAVLVAGALVPSQPRFCLPLASAPGVIVAALAARLLALAPAWLGWRRVAGFLR